MRSWARTRTGLECNFKVAFYPGRYAAEKGEQGGGAEGCTAGAWQQAAAEGGTSRSTYPCKALMRKHAHQAAWQYEGRGCAGLQSALAAHRPSTQNPSAAFQ